MLSEFFDWEPYNRNWTFSLALRFKKLDSNFLRFSKSSNLLLEKIWQRKRKCSVVSTSCPHAHMGLTASLKQCLNLCSFRWLKPSLRRVRSLIPRGSYIEKIGFSFFSLTIVLLNMLRDLAFLTLLSRLFQGDLKSRRDQLPGWTLKSFLWTKFGTSSQPLTLIF